MEHLRPDHGREDVDHHRQRQEPGEGRPFVRVPEDGGAAQRTGAAASSATPARMGPPGRAGR